MSTPPTKKDDALERFLSDLLIFCPPFGNEKNKGNNIIDVLSETASLQEEDHASLAPSPDRTKYAAVPRSVIVTTKETTVKEEEAVKPEEPEEKPSLQVKEDDKPEMAPVKEDQKTPSASLFRHRILWMILLFVVLKSVSYLHHSTHSGVESTQKMNDPLVKQKVLPKRPFSKKAVLNESLLKKVVLKKETVLKKVEEVAQRRGPKQKWQNFRQRVREEDSTVVKEIRQRTVRWVRNIPKHLRIEFYNPQ